MGRKLATGISGLWDKISDCWRAERGSGVKRMALRHIKWVII
jgi:hypothetical protein